MIQTSPHQFHENIEKSFADSLCEARQTVSPMSSTSRKKNLQSNARVALSPAHRSGFTAHSRFPQATSPHYVPGRPRQGFRALSNARYCRSNRHSCGTLWTPSQWKIDEREFTPFISIFFLTVTKRPSRYKVNNSDWQFFKLKRGVARRFNAIIKPHRGY